MNQDSTLWILEDNISCNFVYQESLKDRYNLRFFNSLDEISLAIANPGKIPDLLITDISLPDGSFVEILTKTNNLNFLNQVGFLVISSVEDMDVMRLCLDEGALDYLVKPFNKNELMVKIEKIITKGKRTKLNTTSVKSMDLNDPAFQSFTLKERQILQLFLSEPNLTLTRSMILNSIWAHVKVHAKTFDVHLYNLRKKLHSLGWVVEFNNGKWSLKLPGESQISRELISDQNIIA